MSKVLSILIAFTTCVVIGASCIQDECADTTCVNGGVCVKGVCACTSGYEGESCEKKWADKFEGAWNVVDKDDSFSYSYGLKIYELVKDTFSIVGFRDSLDTVYCYRVSNHEFSMIAKTFTDTTRKVSSGTGKLDEYANTVTGLYSFSINDSVVSTNFTWTR